MKTASTLPFDGSSSAPNYYAYGSGAGSLTATIISQGVVVSRYTPQGTIRPFGEDTGTADDNSLLSEPDIVSHADGCNSTARPEAAQRR